MEIVLDLSVEIEGYDEITDEEKLKKYIWEVIHDEYEPEKPVYISLYITDNESIQEINKNYRGKDMPTDVISFAYHETDDFNIGPYDTLGDIVISLERVEEQCKEYGHSLEREFFYVLTHGLLHLLGYDLTSAPSIVRVRCSTPCSSPV